MSEKRIAVIACGVLEWHIDQVIRRIPERKFMRHTMPAQLHQNPTKLRELLQAKIDEWDAEPDLEGIVIGYGVCGRGTVGLYTRTVPVVLPRAQDCIGIYLGSQERYLQEFSRQPGTRYLTRGWYDKTIRVRAPQHYLNARDHSLYGATRAELEARYGSENAGYICEFRDSWKRNYQRAAYIRFPEEVDVPPGQALSAALARDLGWDHEVLEGDDSLLFALLSGTWHDPRILVVPAASRTVSAPGRAVFGFTAGVDPKVAEILRKYKDADAATAPVRTGLGLGIDTGGTFTDAVVFDFGAGSVLAQAKAPTTHTDLVVGITDALDQLPAELLSRIHRVGLSTTLATNAFVERKGRPVGLLLMSPVAVHLDTFPFRFVRMIDGVMTLEGEEREALDPDQIRKAALAAHRAGCEALAISGFGSVVNPQHERDAARIALAASALHAVCGHELTSQLNFMERATTAAMNAKLIPLIERLLEAVREALAAKGLGEVRVMVVKGDGSQMLDRVARNLPVETVLSGPAASVVGAAYLFANRTAVVVDMGGTTLDVARLHEGAPVISGRGARIGEFQTSVKAMAVTTIGLGGDSELDLHNWPQITIGPRRVLPLCRLRADFPEQTPNLLRDIAEHLSFDANATDVVAAAAGTAKDDRIEKLLASGPLLLARLARRLNRACPDHIPWRVLESEGRLRRYGLTLTDILHHERRYEAFDRTAVERVLQLWAGLLGVPPAEIVTAVHSEFRRRVCDTILQTSLPAACPWATDEALREWLTAHLADTSERQLPARFRVELGAPVIAVGAPVAALFPSLEPVLHQKVLISEFASVTNAVGAIAGDVLIREQAVIKVTADGDFVCSGCGLTRRASSLVQALQFCEAAVTAEIEAQAAANEVPFAAPTFVATRQEAETRDGPIFFGVTLQGELCG